MKSITMATIVASLMLGGSCLASTGSHDHSQCQVLVPEATGLVHRGSCGDREIIDILWVYTPAALEYWGSVSEVNVRCAQAISDCNLTFENTQLPFRVRTVGVHGTVYEEHPTDYLGHIADPDDGYMDEVHAVRDEVAADIVVLVSVVGCGLAFVSPTNEAYGFQQCSVNCWPTAFRHELGHNLGSQHYTTDTYGYFSWSSGHRLIPDGGTEIGTAMGGNNIPHFSNPNVMYGGVPTGVAPGPDHEADNYLAFMATAPMVADFRCSGDCDGNGVPDETEIADGSAADCDSNGIPDVCQVDFDQDGVIDACQSDLVSIRVPEDISAIQVAIVIAESGVHEVIVGPGTWPGSLDLLGKNIVLRSLQGADSTIIDASGAAHAMMIRNNEGPEAVIQGFTFTGGSGDTYGGGMLIEGASPTIQDCIFAGNSATYAGGGMRITDGAPHLEGCQFRDNQAPFGGGVSSWQGTPVFTNCRFTGNLSQTGGHGGGYSSWDSPVTFNGCEFRRNTCEDGTGGGLFTNSNTNYLAVLAGCSFCGNTPDDINSSVWQDNGENVFEDICASCPGDANGDGLVNVKDVLRVISVWNSSDPDADFDDDGVVGVNDILIVIDRWGICP